MEKRKRGGFSFLDTKKPKAKAYKKVVHTRTVNAPAVRFIENKAESQNLQRYIDGAKACIGEICDLNKVDISQIYKGPYLHRYFYIYFNLDNDVIENILNALSIKFQNSIECKSIIITYIHNALTRVLAPPPREKEPSKLNMQYVHLQKTSEKKTKHISSIPKTEKPKAVKPSLEKGIRIDINMDDIDEFLDYLEKRVPERNTRNRYIENIKSLHANGWNQYRHSTFIDNNKYKVNAKEIEVFVNGMKSRDFNIKVKEYEDALELYLSYCWAKDYTNPIMQDKDEAIPPKFKERPKNKKKIEKQDVDGKKIFVNIEHLDGWKSSKIDEDKDTLQPSNGVVYVGEPVGQRKSATIQNATIIEKEEVVEVNINLDGKLDENIPQIPDNETHFEEVPIEIPVEAKDEIDIKEVGEQKKLKESPKKNMGWFARMMLRFWNWYYKRTSKD